jgi:hypothetical protein
MNTKSLAFMALLLAVGAGLHIFTPGIFLGMKPDMLLAMMFIGIILFPQTKNVLLLAFGTGFISALTTTFPGGQIPNMIDKPITAFVFLGLFLLFRKHSQTVVGVAVLTAIGTMISGAIFLSSALIFAGLPGGATFGALFGTVVLSATVANTIINVVVYPVVKGIAKRTNLAVS